MHLTQICFTQKTAGAKRRLSGDLHFRSARDDFIGYWRFSERFLRVTGTAPSVEPFSAVV